MREQTEKSNPKEGVCGLCGHSLENNIEITPEHLGISGMRVAVMPMEKPESPLFTMSCYSNRVVLVPPDKNLLLHVTSDGFYEWDESVGKGKPLRLPSEARLTLAVHLEPSQIVWLTPGRALPERSERVGAYGKRLCVAVGNADRILRKEVKRG